MAHGMPGFFDVDERLKELTAKGDDLERINSLVDFEIFRPVLEAAVPRGDRRKGLSGGRPDRALLWQPFAGTRAPVAQSDGGDWRDRLPQ